jgi:hypothetical protein
MVISTVYVQYTARNTAGVNVARNAAYVKPANYTAYVNTVEMLHK